MGGCRPHSGSGVLNGGLVMTPAQKTGSIKCAQRQSRRLTALEITDFLLPRLSPGSSVAKSFCGSDQATFGHGTPAYS